MALAAMVWAGATLAVPVPKPALVAAVALAVAARRPAVVVLVGFVLGSGLGAAALRGLEPPVEAPFSGWVTLLTDPAPVASGQRVEVRLGHRHVEAWARGAAAGMLVDRSSGERVLLDGRLGPVPEPRPWLTARHVSGRLEVERVSAWDPGGPVVRIANGLRRTLVSGASPLPDDTRALFAGFVLGDDRGRSALVTDDFRGSGLTHLLAVSGQNVAFVLALLDPLLRRLGLRGRLVATVAALAFFALLTRFEPSVLRATTMAAIAAVAATWGREASSVRVLALAVAALVLVDPLLVGAVGFQLSVAACLGIVVLAPRLRRLVPGPEVLRLPLAVSLAAQVGVAPILIAVFGGVPVAGLPANLLAAPAAGPVTTWGLTAGLVAGVVPAAAGVLHAPTRVLVGWVAGVARFAVALPLGQLGFVTFALCLTAGGLAAVLRLRGRVALARAACAALLVVLMVPAVQLRWAPVPAHESLGAGAELWRSEGRALVSIDGRVREDDLLAALRSRGVTRLDVVVVRSAAGGLHAVAADLSRRYGRMTVIAPRDAGITAARAPASGSSLRLGALVVRFTVSGDQIDLEVEPASGAAGGPV